MAQCAFNVTQSARLVCKHVTNARAASATLTLMLLIRPASASQAPTEIMQTLQLARYVLEAAGNVEEILSLPHAPNVLRTLFMMPFLGPVTATLDSTLIH